MYRKQVNIETSKELEEKEDNYSVIVAFMNRLASLDDTNKECFEHIIHLSFLLPQKKKKTLNIEEFLCKNLISANLLSNDNFSRQCYIFECCCIFVNYISNFTISYIKKNFDKAFN